MAFSSISYRQFMIINILLNNNKIITVDELSLIIGVSDRTIRNDLIEIERLFKLNECFLINIRGRGFELKKEDKEQVRYLLNESTNFKLNEFYPRELNIIIFLLNKNSLTNIDDLCDTFYISKTSIEKDLDKIKDILMSFGSEISLKRNKGNILLEGEEKYKRLLIRYIQRELVKIPGLKNDIYLTHFDKSDFDFLIQLITTSLIDNNLQLSDNSIISFTLHILVALNRIVEGFDLIKNEKSFYKDINNLSEELEIINNISKVVLEKYNILLSTTEKQSLLRTLSLKKIINTEGLKKDYVIKNIDNHYISLVTQLIDDIKQEFTLDLSSDDELFIGLVYHIKNLFLRLEYKTNYFNPILEEFKVEYPFVFELAIFIRNRLKDLVGIDLNENELSFFAIHLGTYFERQRQLDIKGKIRVLLLSHSNASNTKFLITKLKSIFSNDIYINKVSSSLKVSQEDIKNVDLIVSTTDYSSSNYSLPIIKIHPLLNKNDVTNIKEGIDSILYTKGTNFINYFKKDLFYTDLEYENYFDLISFLSDDLFKNNYVYKSFKSSCIEREKLSTTIIKHGIAIPHPLNPLSKQSCISVAILNKRKIWLQKPVQIIFMIAMTKTDQKNLKDFLDFIVYLMEDENLLNKLVNSNTFESFFDILTDYQS